MPICHSHFVFSFPIPPFPIPPFPFHLSPFRPIIIQFPPVLAYLNVRARVHNLLSQIPPLPDKKSHFLSPLLLFSPLFSSPILPISHIPSPPSSCYGPVPRQRKRLSASDHNTTIVTFFLRTPGCQLSWSTTKSGVALCNFWPQPVISDFESGVFAFLRLVIYFCVRFSSRFPSRFCIRSFPFPAVP